MEIKMIKKNIKDPLVIGVIIFVALILLSLMVFYAGGYSIKRGYSFYVLFKYSDGILNNTPVNIAGVNYGHVNNINIIIVDNEPYVQMELKLYSSDIVFNDAKIFISTAGFLGEKFIEIDPGSSAAGVVERGQTIRGVDPVRSTEILNKVFDILENTDKIVSSVTEIFYTDETKQDFMIILDNLKKSSFEINNMINENREIVGKSITNIEKSTENFVAASSKINHIVDESEYLILNSLSQINNSSEKFGNSINDLSEIIPVITKDIAVSAENVKSITEETNSNLNSIFNNFNIASDNIKMLTEDVKNPDNNIGHFIYSKDIYNNISKASENIKNATEYIKFNPWVLFRSRSNPLSDDDFK
jgi:phospholipid/cholesterol/gamma-HCH transport system substrate-binding protein